MERNVSATRIKMDGSFDARPVEFHLALEEMDNGSERGGIRLAVKHDGKILIRTRTAIDTSRESRDLYAMSQAFEKVATLQAAALLNKAPGKNKLVLYGESDAFNVAIRRDTSFLEPSDFVCTLFLKISIRDSHPLHSGYVCLDVKVERGEVIRFGRDLERVAEELSRLAPP